LHIKQFKFQEDSYETTWLVKAENMLYN